MFFSQFNDETEIAYLLFQLVGFIFELGFMAQSVLRQIEVYRTKSLANIAPKES